VFVVVVPSGARVLPPAENPGREAKVTKISDATERNEKAGREMC
jgi:hypothetical protein